FSVGSGTRDPFVAKLNGSGALQWNTFLGQSGADTGFDLTMDATGNLYVVGTSSAAWVETPLVGHHGGTDTFVAKLNGSGALEWYTFLGGAGTDQGNALTINPAGSLFVAGYSSADWGWGTVIRGYTGSSFDMFVFKLLNDGTYQWHTFLGGPSSDMGEAIARDDSGNLYVYGTSQGTWGAPKRAYTAGRDGSAAKLNSGGVLQWNTFLGGALDDFGYGVAVSAGGSSFLVGYSNNSWGTPLRSYTAFADGYVARLDTDGNLQWNTFWGGASFDSIYGIFRHPGTTDLYLSGYSSADWGAPIRDYSGGQDGFLVRMDNAGSIYWQAFVGDTGNEIISGAGLDSSLNPYVIGHTNAPWGTGIGGEDVFVSRLFGTQSVTYAEPAGDCDSHTPCYTTITEAINEVSAGGRVYVYAGTYGENVTLGKNAIVTLLDDVTINGSLTLNDGLWRAPADSDTLTLTGNLAVNGGTFSHNNGTVTFNGSGTQNLSVNATTAFHNLTVNSGVTLIETVAANNVTVGGALTNNGVIRKSQPISSVGNKTFGLTGVQMNVTTVGSLSSVRVDRVDSNHPHATGPLQTGRYWTITPTGGGYAVNLTLPHNNLSSPYVCRYVDPNWDWGRDSSTSSTVTRNGITEFSDWAVSDGQPTAVTLAAFTATPAPPSLTRAWETFLRWLDGVFRPLWAW
ncbi:MAG: SBBP repeat-containing protein, partial [Chloroflexi bacterium]|nr:SBBP repeat-containing protein [Chloroflexota bacterium]